MLDELNMNLEMLENELEEAQEAYEISDSRKHKKDLYGQIKRMEKRMKLLKRHIAMEECMEME